MRSIAKAALTSSRVGAVIGRVPGFARAYDKYVWRRELNLYSGVFASHAEAVAACPPDLRAGWDAPEVAKLVVGDEPPRPTRPWSGPDMPSMLHQTSAYAALLWISRFLKPGDRLVDVGGASGISRFQFDHYYRMPEGATWTVVDRPEIVARGKALREKVGVQNLAFTSEMRAQQPCDVLIAFGCLQYLSPDDLNAFYRMAESARAVVVNKMPLIEGEAYWTLQNLQTGAAPYMIANRSAFMAPFEAAGFNLTDAWPVHEITIDIPFAPDKRVPFAMGFAMEKDL